VVDHILGMPLAQQLDPRTDPRWDAYVRAHPAATAYHLGAWAEILRGAYGFQPRYLALEEDGRLRGVLPLMRKKGLVSDARLRSIPVFSYGGPLADSPAEEAALLEAARAEAARGDVAGLSVNTGVRELQAAEFTGEEILPRWVVELPDDLEALRSGWRKTSNNLFRSLRKADRAELRFREAESERDLRSVHTLYVRTMRGHRSLPRTLRQLRLERDLLGPHLKMFIVARDDRDLAGAVYHVFGDTIELVYNGSDERSLELRPNHALYWGVMRWARERGLRTIDLGGAYEDTPLARFKQQWGARPQARFRLNHRPGGGTTRAESIASIGYGAEGSERRIVDFAWRHVPLTLLRAGAHVAYRYV
jgi:CelD/BcsL family acetyltransferase involved in cellulose biosynthesis